VAHDGLICQGQWCDRRVSQWGVRYAGQTDRFRFCERLCQAYTCLHSYLFVKRQELLMTGINIRRQAVILHRFAAVLSRGCKKSNVDRF